MQGIYIYNHNQHIVIDCLFNMELFKAAKKVRVMMKKLAVLVEERQYRITCDEFLTLGISVGRSSTGIYTLNIAVWIVYIYNYIFIHNSQGISWGLEITKNIREI